MVHVHAHPGAAGEASKKNPVLRVQSQDREQSKRQSAAQNTVRRRAGKEGQRGHDRDEINEMEEVPDQNQAEQCRKEERRPEGTGVLTK
jgi:hypothetical protein